MRDVSRVLSSGQRARGDVLARGQRRAGRRNGRLGGHVRVARAAGSSPRRLLRPLRRRSWSLIPSLTRSSLRTPSSIRMRIPSSLRSSTLAGARSRSPSSTPIRSSRSRPSRIPSSIRPRPAAPGSAIRSPRRRERQARPRGGRGAHGASSVVARPGQRGSILGREGSRRAAAVPSVPSTSVTQPVAAHCVNESVPPSSRDSAKVQRHAISPARAAVVLVALGCHCRRGVRIVERLGLLR